VALLELAASASTASPPAEERASRPCQKPRCRQA
jgi:hypothetical protein